MPEITEKELPPNLKPLWLKALTAVQASNLDYAIITPARRPQGQPGIPRRPQVAPQMRTPTRRRRQEKRRACSASPTGGMGVMKLQSQAKKDPLATLPLIEKELEKDPLNDQANDLLFDVCVKLELFETAAFALETVRQGSPENAKLLHKLAEFYLNREQPMLASEVYNDIIKHHPTDGVAIKGSKDASARASMQKQKWDENADMRDLMRDVRPGRGTRKSLAHRPDPRTTRGTPRQYHRKIQRGSQPPRHRQGTRRHLRTTRRLAQRPDLLQLGPHPQRRGRRPRRQGLHHE